MLNSRACRSAIMFNDELSKEQCQTLVSNLASCKFPFQCAHGRPSLVPLVNLWRVEMGAREQANNERLGADLSIWKRNMNSV
jgi:DNA mismatch repair protein MLH3